MSLEVTVLDTLIKHGLWCFNTPLVLAVSGGRDSMVMLDVLKRLAVNPDQNLIIAHIDHSARVNSGKDSEFVQRCAIRNGLPCFAFTIQPWKPSSGESAEQYWRRKRYSILLTLRKKIGAHAIATAHTASDHLETLILRITQGTGPRGFLGIRTQRKDSVIRPLLNVTRSEVTDYAINNDISWIDDPGNEDESVPRNLVRAKVIPVLQKLNPLVAQASVRASKLLEVEDALLSRQAENILRSAGWKQQMPSILDSRIFYAEPDALIKRCAAALYADISPSYRVTSAHIEHLMHCLTGRKSFCPLPDGSSAWNNDGCTILIPVISRIKHLKLLDSCSQGDHIIGGYHVNIEDTETSEITTRVFGSPEFIIRTRLPHDKYLRNSDGKLISLSEVFRSRKIHVKLRDMLPLLVNKQGFVEWIGNPFEKSCIFICFSQIRSFKLTCQPRSVIRWE